MATHILQQEAEPLFKAKTIRQKKIAEWLSANGVTRVEISEVELKAPGLVRITYTSGEYANVLCSTGGEVSISPVTPEREKYLDWAFWFETNDPETQEWRDDLTADEAALVEHWDEAVSRGICAMCKKLPDTSPQQAAPQISILREEIER